MRHHPRPFVVEVKRGTSRQSFQSHSLDLDKFGAAEKLLFSAPQIERETDSTISIKPGPAGRVLPVLADLHQIVLADPFPAPRRGRPPGSKNKIKQCDPPVPVAKPLTFKATFDSGEIEELVIADQHSPRELLDEEVLFSPALPELSVEPSEEPTRSLRLRDRSRILRRYVLGIEPRAGERRSFRNRKAAASDVKRER